MRIEPADAGVLLVSPSVKRALFTLLFLFISFGCASSKPERPEVELEYIDRAQVVREEVAAHPKQFDTDEDVYTIWKRAGLLSTTYINTDSKPKVVKSPSSKEGFHLQHTPKAVTPDNRFGYEILAVPTRKGLTVRVNAVDLQTRTKNDQSELFAKNLARFLKTGTLERSLLTP